MDPYTEGLRDAQDFPMIWDLRWRLRDRRPRRSLKPSWSFEAFVEYCLAPTLRAGQVVLDNLCIQGRKDRGLDRGYRVRTALLAALFN